MKLALLLLVGALLAVATQDCDDNDDVDNGRRRPPKPWPHPCGRCPSPTTLPCVFGCTPDDRACPGGDLCCLNACRTGYSCASPVNERGVPKWCPAGSPFLNCFVNPCRVMRCPNFPWAVCINGACEPECTGDFYLYSRRLSFRECHG